MSPPPVASPRQRDADDNASFEPAESERGASASEVYYSDNPFSDAEEAAARAIELGPLTKQALASSVTPQGPAVAPGDDDDEDNDEREDGGVRAICPTRDDMVVVARARDWSLSVQVMQKHVLEEGRDELRVLDVGAGASESFPAALVSSGGLLALLAAGDAQRLICDVARSTPRSVDGALAELRRPFVRGDAWTCSLEDMEWPRGRFDFVWAFHALNETPPEALPSVLRELALAGRPGGELVLAQTASDAHYASYRELYAQAYGIDDYPRVVSGEHIVAALEAVGVPHEVSYTGYTTVFPPGDDLAVERFLASCAGVAGPPMPLEEQLAQRGPLSRYLRSCRATDRSWCFPQRVVVVYVRL